MNPVMFALALLLLAQGSYCFDLLNFDLCPIFITGGTCEVSCDHEARHRWSIPLCLNGLKCCIPPEHPLIQHFRASLSTTTSAQPIRTTTVPVANQQPTCGRRRSRPRIRRVVGGQVAAPRSWPWQVAIRRFTGQYICSGVLINRNWILTAAHCFQTDQVNPPYLRAYVGHQTLSYGFEGRNGTLPIQRIIMHPDFRRDVEVTAHDSNVNFRRHYNDLALVQLQQGVEFTGTVQPVCLPGPDGQDTPAPQDCWVAGWGQTSANSRATIVDLHEVHGSVVTNQACGGSWGTTFANDVVCFGGSGQGPCMGDSGGGLYCREEDGRFTLVGVVSMGREDCIHDNHPSILSRVAAYSDWITNTMSSADRP